MTAFLESELVVLPDLDVLARRGADWLLERVRTREGRLGVCVTGGSTPRRLYETLAASPYREAFPWDRVHWFWSDERFVPWDHPRSNYGMARDALLRHVPVPPGHVHAIPTSLPTPAAAAAAYERELRQFHGGDVLRAERPLFDAMLLGLGADGHIASLFPGSALLDERSRWAAGVPAGAETEARVTLTYPALESTRAVAFVVAGGEKRAILTRLRSGAQVPASRFSPLTRPAWFVDRAAAPEQSPRALPSVIVVMGVSGAGKTTVGRLLAQRLHWRFEDADSLHPAANIAKMRGGAALTDEDRWPWLREIARWIDTVRGEEDHGVITCSALKRPYRSLLVDGRRDVRLVLLNADRALVARRHSARAAAGKHFMPASLLDSQFDALEEPHADEDAIVVSADRTPEEIVERICAALEAHGTEATPATGGPP